MSGVAGDEREFRGRFSGFRGSPDNIGGFNASVRQMVDAGELRDIKNEAAIVELTHLILVEVFHFEATAGKFEAVKIGRVILFEGSDEGLHV